MVTADQALQGDIKDARVHYPENKNHKPPPTPQQPQDPASGNAGDYDPAAIKYWCGFRVISQNPNSVSKPTPAQSPHEVPLLTHQQAGKNLGCTTQGPNKKSVVHRRFH
jgi:hypothetical protein